MEKHFAEIRVDKKYMECEFDFDMPCVLADQIRELVKNFYKDEYSL